MVDPMLLLVTMQRVGTTNTAPEMMVLLEECLLMKIGNDVFPNIAIEVIRVAVGDSSYQVKADAGGIMQ